MKLTRSAAIAAATLSGLVSSTPTRSFVGVTDTCIPNPPAPSCTPSTDSCSFYDCLEAEYHCGPSGYPIGYGQKYCEKFGDSSNGFSTEGQDWVLKTRVCLQEALVPELDCSSSCEEVNNNAFDSHPQCYVSSGVCFLPVTDWFAIERVVGWKTLISSWDSVEQVIKTGAGCADLYFWLLKEIFNGDD